MSIRNPLSTRQTRRFLNRFNSTYSGLSNAPMSARINLNRLLLSSGAFCFSVSLASYALAAEQTNADVTRTTEGVKARLGNSIRNRINFSLRSDQQWPTSQELAAERRYFVYKRVQSTVNSLSSSATEAWRNTVVYVAEAWLNRSEAQRTCLGLIGLQGVVFAAWQIPGLQQTMTAVFSHQSTLHFAFNSIAFYSIGTSAHSYFWSRQRDDQQLKSSTSRYEFLAFFVAGGLAASLASQSHTILRKVPQVLRQGAAASGTSNILPSLGASGAIWSCLSVSALAFPDASVSLIILPFVPISIGYGVLGMAALDVVGLIRGWRMFDHAAHLGGAGFGLLYYFLDGNVFVWLRKILSPANDNQLKRVT